MYVLLFSLVLFSTSQCYICSSGQDCVRQQVCVSEPLPCTGGTFCPGGNNSAFPCPKGSFCEEPFMISECESGSYCRTGSRFSKKCEVVSLCPTGTWKVRRFLWILLFIIIVFLFGLGIFAWKKLSKRSSITDLPSMSESNSTKIDVTVEKKQNQIDITFKDVGLTKKVKGKTKVILAGVTGEFNAGEVNAIMGPSGAGKTSFMNVISARTQHTTGTIFVNGKEESLSKYTRAMGYVPQDDIMLSDLTVREILNHSAKLRLPGSWSMQKKMEKVEEVLAVLKLKHIENSVVGNVEKRGISGGEKKRVSIGIELVADPKILFLDEPTTGLDATTAKDVMQFLQDIAATGVNVIAVIHQPRYEILEVCNKLLLLGKGGKTVYLGPTSDCVSYFASKGFPCPPLNNPADFFMEVVSGYVFKEEVTKTSTLSMTHSFGPENLSKPRVVVTDPKLLIQIWEEHVKEVPNKKNYSTSGDIIDSKPTNFFVQVALLVYRCFLQQVRGINLFILEVCLTCIPGTAIGINNVAQEIFAPALPRALAVTCPAVIREKCLDTPFFGNANINAFFITMIAGVTAAINGTPPFGDERNIFYREAGTGQNLLTYFLAKNIFDIWNIFRSTFLFLMMYFVIADPPGEVADWFAIVFLCIFAMWGMTYITSIIFPSQFALIFAVIISVAWAVTSGNSPKVTDITWDGYGPLPILWWLSHTRWASEAVIITIVREWNGLDQDRVIERYGFDPNNISLDYGMLFAIGIFWRVIAFFVLKWDWHRKSKK